MRIAIFIEQLFSTSTGERRYLNNMLPALLRQGREHSFTLFHSANYDGDTYPRWLRELPSNARVVRLPLRRKPLLVNWIVGLIPIECWLGKHDIFEHPSLIPIHTWSGLRVVTIHDVAPLELPSEHNWACRLINIIGRNLIQTRGDRILTVSEFTAERARARLSLTDSNPVVIHYGVDPCFRMLDASEVKHRLKRFTLQRPFFLFIGALNRRKNVYRLLQAFARCVHMEGLGYDLVLAGPDMFPPGKVQNWISSLGIADRVRSLGLIPDEELVGLLNAAEALVFPSLYEGFGLPVLEAMACGTPVICSGTTGLGEIAGPALRVNPEVVESIAGAMTKLATGCIDQCKLIEEGLKHAASFTWEATARKKLADYNKISKDSLSTT